MMIAVSPPSLDTSEYLPNEAMLKIVVASAHEAQHGWATVPLRYRAKVLQAIAQAIRDHAEALAKRIEDETGKSMSDALTSDVAIAAGSFRQAAELGLRCLKPQGYPLSQSWRALALGRSHQTLYSPKGVVAAITPWNYPIGIPAWAIAASLMTGNACILKPSELSPESGKALVALVQEVLENHGYSKNLVICVTGDGSVGRALLDEPVDHVLFTGSVGTGRAIQAQLAGRNIGLSLELGGSCPALILPSLDKAYWDSVISQITWGRCFNAGQSCAAIKRLLLPNAGKEEWLERLAATFNAIAQPLVLINHTQRQRLHQQVVQALAEGATLVCRGTFNESSPTPVYPPTLITNLPPQSHLWQEEWFGPVLLVDGFDTVAEAIEKANNTSFGLTASVFGPQAEAEKMAQKLQAGLVTVNDVALAHYGFLHVPWQGVKNSGPGISHSTEGLLALVTAKTMGINTLPTWIKPPWLLQKSAMQSSQSSGHPFQHGLIRWMSHSFWRAQWNPALLKGLWQQRPRTRL
ncbi:MAG: aldehyde dehydrogenase family protein [Vampirovibrionales bacterium]|nr:aldehyde dehydrogenase family protein [Vampirovibrionales bacterium]